MAHPALLLAGNMAHGPEGDDEEDMKEDPHEMKLDAVRHLMAALASKKEEDVLECLENLIELSRDDEMPEKDEPEDDEESPKEEPEY